MDYAITMKGIQPMLWETDQKKRNINNICTFSVPDDTTLKVGDRITAPHDKEKNSVYEVLEILESKPSLLKGRTYYKVKTNWYLENLNDGLKN